MWEWIKIFILSIVLIAILEESIYYFWNRYVYGKKQRRWLQKTWLLLIKVKYRKNNQSEIQKDVDSP